MIHILKNREPQSFTTYRLTQDASYANIPSTVKDDLKKSLLEEQGYLCAYCMSRISLEKMKIEHFLPQSVYPSESLEYSNLLAVCRGYEGECSQNQTCDTKKSNGIISINPLNKTHINNITYSNDGTINSTSYHNDLHTILNLNLNSLKNNRKKVLDDFKQKIYNRFKNKSMNKDTIKIMIEKYKHNPTKEVYIGIVISYLKNRV